MAGVALVSPRRKYVDATGTPIALGTLTVYYAGTTTLATTYQNQALTTANTNPIELDANGECLVWVDDTFNYKELVKDAAGATVSGYPVDNIRGAGASISGVSDVTVDRFSGTGAQTAFTLTTTPDSEDATEVYVSGVYIQKNAYSVAGTTLTFAVAPASGTNNIEVNTFGYTDYPAAATAIAASQAAAAVSATASATSATASSASATAGAASAAAAALSESQAAAIVLGNFLQDGPGAGARTFTSKAREVLSFEDNAADSTGAADASTEITEVFTEAMDSHRPVRVGGKNYKLTSAIELPYHVEADFGQAFIDASGVTAGQYAITANNQADLTTLQYPSMWKGLRLQLGSSGAYGVKIDAPTGSWAISNFAAETWSIKGGAVGLAFGENTWLVNFRNLMVLEQSELGIDAQCAFNAGEGINFYAGTIAGVTNGGSTGIGVKTDKGVGSSTWKFFGTSFTYSDVQIHHTAGLLELHGCHVESDGANPMVKLEQVIGRAVLNFNAFGTEWLNAAGSTRTKIIEVTGNPVINIQGGNCHAIANTEGLEFVSVPASGDTPSINIKGVNFNLFPGMSQAIGRICGKTSLARNGDFETGTLDGWGMDAVNFLRNGVFTGGVTGSAGTFPTDMGLHGALNGLTQTLTFSYTDDGRPVMRVRFNGNASSTSSTGIYFYNGTGIASTQGDLWKQRCYIRTVGAPTGVNAYFFQISERDSGGSAVGATSSAAISPTTVRALYDFSHTTAQASAAHIRPAFYFTYTNGAAVDVTLEFDTPSLMLAPMVYEDIIRSDTGATLPTYRVQAAAAGGRTAAKCLKLYSTAVESVGVYATVPVKSRDWLVGRGYAHITARTAGEVGLKLSWRDALGTEISAQNVRPTYLSTTGSYLQQSGVRAAPVGSERARLHCWLEAFHGTVLFDDVEAWTV